jgi:hypothetical protein
LLACLPCRPRRLKEDGADIVRWSSYVGQGAVRFYLPLDEQLGNPFFGQVVIVARNFDAAEGLTPWNAVVEATMHRMRPILLTAAAASLGMIPIAREVFWGPMAFAMIGGIVFATLLTLLFLPALYVAWYRIQEPA